MDASTEQTVRRILTDNRVVAVIGAHPETSRAANYVPAYLAGHGYRILPVNAPKAGTPLFGEVTRATVTEHQGPVDLVCLFRNSAAVPGHVGEILALDPLPKVVWMQLGIESAEARAAFEAQGIEVIEDRCMLADHRALGLGAPS